jgi:hypothetical protein
MTDTAKLPIGSATVMNQRAPTDLAAPSLTDLANKIKDAHQSILNAPKNVVVRAIMAGEALSAAKEIVGHGNWLKWLQENCAMSDKTAERYMNLAKSKSKLLAAFNERGEFESLSNLTLAAAEKLIDGPPSSPDQSASGETGKNKPGNRNDKGRPFSVKNSDGYDKVQEVLIGKLELMGYSEADAAATNTKEALKEALAKIKNREDEAKRKQAA